MFGPVLLLLPLALLGLGVLVGIVVLALTARPDATLPAELAAARRHAVLGSAASAVVTLLVLVALGAAVLLLDTPAALVGVTPLLAAAGALCALLGTELSWPRPSGAVRTARLQDRSLPSVAAGRWPRWAGVVCLAVGATVVVGGLLGDDTGQMVTHTFGNRTSGAGPFPGWSYGLPQLLALALCLALALLVARAATLRSAVLTADPEADLTLRRASLSRAARMVAAAAALTLGGDLFLGGAAARRVFEDGLPHAVSLVTMLVGLVALVGGLSTLLVPVPRLSGSEHPAPTVVHS